MTTPEQGERPPAPRDLSDRQRALWIDITAAKPASWFTRDQLPLLRALVAHCESFERIEAEIRTAGALDTGERLDWFGKLTKLRDRESRAVKSLSVALRLTNQSRYTPGAAGTAARKPAGPAPWEYAGK
ncbi:MAG: hypothetical protein AB7G13_22395 [Lautropia sp.]